MMDMPTAAETHIETVVGTDSAVLAIIGVNTITGAPNLYRDMAEDGLPGPSPGPYDPPPPYLVYFSQDTGAAPIEQMFTENPSIGYESLWTVRITGRADDLDRVRTLNQAVYDALDSSTADYPALGMHVTCGLENWLTLGAEVLDGVKWIHRGGTYRILIQPI
jgi:hypothetical protein